MPPAFADPCNRLVGGRYQLTGKIGEGGMGAVYKGFDKVIGRQVAVKMLGEGTTKQEEVVARFHREAQVVGQLRHRNVVEVFDFGVENEIPFMVMELLEGKDLATLIDKRGALPIGRAVDIVLGVAAGLVAAHHSGLVHRDIKPANIFLSREDGDEIPKILDFGISKTSNSRLTQAGSVFGTQHYISPEQARNSADVDARTDQYALGVILYQCVTNRPPHDGDNVYAVIKNIVEGRFAPPRTYCPGMPVRLDAIIVKAMATEPKDRYASVYEMGTELLQFASERGKRQWSDFYSRVPLAPQYSVVVSVPGGTLPSMVPQVAPTDVLPPQQQFPAPRVAPTEVLPPEQQAPAPRAPAPSRPRHLEPGRAERVREPLHAPRPAPVPRRPWFRAFALTFGLCTLAIAALAFFLRPQAPAHSPAKTGLSANAPASPTPPTPPAPPVPPALTRAVALPPPATISKANTVKKEKPRASKKRRARYNDDGVPLIMP